MAKRRPVNSTENIGTTTNSFMPLILYLILFLLVGHGKLQFPRGHKTFLQKSNGPKKGGF
jgi:hypothetical protein